MDTMNNNNTDSALLSERERMILEKEKELEQWQNRLEIKENELNAKENKPSFIDKINIPLPILDTFIAICFIAIVIALIMGATY